MSRVHSLLIAETKIQASPLVIPHAKSVANGDAGSIPKEVNV